MLNATLPAALSILLAGPAVAQEPAEGLLVDGDPIANIRLVEDPERNFSVIMKGDRIFKNSL